MVAHIVRRLREGGEDIGGVGVVTPYSAQVELLTSMLRSMGMAGTGCPLRGDRGPEASALLMPEVKTVDGYQGERA